MKHRKHQRTAIARAWDVEPGISLLQCSQAPDMSGANAAALESAQLSRDQLQWVQKTYADEAPARAAAAAQATKVSNAQLASQQLQDSLAQEGAAHYRTTFKPIEEKIAADAQGYDTAERRAQESGQAMADVGTQADIARRTAMQEAEARGVDPSSGSFAATLGRGAVAEAAAKAAAGNAAAKNVETVGAAKMMDAAGLGRGVVSSQGTQAGLAVQAGSASAASARGALDATTSGDAMVQQGYGQAVNGLQGASNSLTNIGKVSADVSASNSQGMGALAGAGMMALAV